MLLYGDTDSVFRPKTPRRRVRPASRGPKAALARSLLLARDRDPPAPPVRLGQAAPVEPQVDYRPVPAVENPSRVTPAGKGNGRRPDPDIATLAAVAGAIALVLGAILVLDTDRPEPPPVAPKVYSSPDPRLPGAPDEAAGLDGRGPSDPVPVHADATTLDLPEPRAGADREPVAAGPAGTVRAFAVSQPMPVIEGGRAPSRPASISGAPRRSAIPAAPASGPADTVPEYQLSAPLPPIAAGEGAVRLHMHVPRGASATDFAVALDRMRSTGLASAEPKRVGYAVSRTQVRYYHPSDREVAGLVAVRMHGALRDFTGYRPQPNEGTIEIWVGGPAASPDRLPDLSAGIRRAVVDPD